MHESCIECYEHVDDTHTSYYHLSQIKLKLPYFQISDEEMEDFLKEFALEEST